ncbi:hypothetical protein RJ640_014421 [Escallonia rubra]|uniref:RNB domain-containing protein n=1 Tax=Escallonia rubra TaxID=112253 RepID=A0AA88QLX3_9ASTE|nr:hypothetical protein RJ640_014421 [Escallonia rubra]
MEGMSLKQGKLCNAVSVSVVLRSDGSIAEYTVCNSVTRPTYMLTYESASELLHLNLEEEVELRMLGEATGLRLQWRRKQYGVSMQHSEGCLDDIFGAIETASLETRIKVANPDDPDPSINLYVENQADPAMRLVSEMMILCGEAIATFGSDNNLPLAYRGQPQSNIDASLFFFFNVKAFLRGDSPPFSAGQLEGIASIVNMHARVAKRLFNSSLWYWLLEYLRRQPKDKRFRALILKSIKDRIAALLLVEVGFQASAWVSVGSQIGDEVELQVEELIHVMIFCLSRRLCVEHEDTPLAGLNSELSLF